MSVVLGVFRRGLNSVGSIMSPTATTSNVGYMTSFLGSLLGSFVGSYRAVTYG